MSSGVILPGDGPGVALPDMLRRLLFDDLVEWKREPARKPLLLDGARQVGKTWLIDRIFGPREFRAVHRFDFRREPGLGRLFADSLDPRVVLSNLELHVDAGIDVERDLVFFDEVGECQPAVDALKYFAEALPQAFVCASGSNVGLLDSFPVGKVRQLEMFPLCFEEFVMAAGRPRLVQGLRERRRGAAVHQQLWPLLLDYYFVGGMPEAVAHWFESAGSLRERAAGVVRIHRELVTGYRRDFGKYAGRLAAQHIDAVFSNVPRQLAACGDGSVQRFRFGNAIARKRRYRDLRGPIDWLEAAKLVRKCYPVRDRPRVPLWAQAQPNIFRLYLFDVGLLGHMLGLSYADQRAQDFSFKGYVAENFVQTELSARVAYPTFGWQQAQAEIEFLHRARDGAIVPVEVKSGRRTRARSLRSYVARYQPRRAIKLVGGPGGDGVDRVETWPLYHAQHLRDL